ncbi:L,D-transpeptidase family protein [Roseovarius nitratireducens]|uniref:L,D-transpeptidase family protein n=1 Tax=Roseovarius nitratireducens TaxID=2044597 RepID=UPI000CE1CFAF
MSEGLSRTWLGIGLGLWLAGAAGAPVARAEGAQTAVPTVIPAVMAGAMAKALDAARDSAFRQAVAEAAGSDRDLAEFYSETDYRPVWTGDDATHRARRAALLRALDDAALHGLPEGRYGRAALLARMADIRSTREMGEVEVALSRAYLAYARDVQSGVLVPGRVDSDIKRSVPRRAAGALLADMMQGDPRAVLRGLPPQTNAYRRLMKERLRLEGVIARGGWGPVVPGGKLEPGDAGAAVIALRDRLVAKGFLARSATARFDGRIQAAVQAFQADHGLETDGIAGPSTIAALNVSPEERLASVLVAMERERWLPAERGARHILVNLADFSARILDDDSVTFETRAVVGKNAGGRRSPEFSDEMEHMIVNPTWHVPRSITVKEYLPKMQANRNAAGHLRIYDSRGRVVPRSAVNFNAYSARSFPFRLKQPPSTRNALGLVKFMFPNKYNIYLHDTPQKHLFDREKRDFSHGCIRLQQPFDFAYMLLAPQEADPKGRFHAVLDTGRETRINLEQHVPVHLIYRTAITRAGGRTQYRDDVYGRDARIWQALERAGVSLRAHRS